MSLLEIEISPSCVGLRLDAGKLNVLRLDVVRELRDRIRAAEADPEIEVVVLEGNATAFCAGLDLETLSAGGPSADDLLSETGRLLLDVYASPLRFVAACTGHAVAAGAMLLLVSDIRIGVEGTYRIGFSEVSYGLSLPEVPVLLARDRLDRRFHQSATLLARLVGPDDSVDVGFLDRVTPACNLRDVVEEEAARLAALDARAYRETVTVVRGPTIERLRATLGMR